MKKFHLFPTRCQSQQPQQPQHSQQVPSLSRNMLFLFTTTTLAFLLFMLPPHVTAMTSIATSSITTTDTLSTIMNPRDVAFNQTQAVAEVKVMVMDQFLNPIQECLTLAPINQYYYPFMYTFDTDYWDFCAIDQPQKVPPEIYKIGSLYLNNNDSSLCENVLCSIERRWDLTNQTQLVSLGVLFNYCLHCNHSSAEQFRQVLSNHSCPSFSTSVNSITQSPTFLSKFNYLADYHCNYNNRRENEPSKHLGLFNYNILMTDYFKRSFLDYSKNNNLFNQTGTFGDANAALKSVSLSTLFNFYFHDLFDKMDSNELPSAPLNVPISCWCNYESENGKSFGFQCNDFYQNWQIMFAYRISTVIFAVLYALVTVFLAFFIVIPRCVERVISFKKRSEIGLETSKFKKFLYFVRHYFDIVTQPPLLLTIGCVTGFLENLLRFAFNFTTFMPLYQVYFPGIFRGLAAIFMICGYSSLVICWSHVIDLANRKTEPNRRGLSKLNIIILSIFYSCVIVVGVISVIIFLAVKNYATAWILLSFAVLIYLLTFVVGFTFYGVKILFALRATAQEKKNFMEYRFTKFILAVTGIFFLGWLVSLGMLVTYIFGYDVLSVFFGLARNQFMDSGLTAVMALSSYITFNDTCFEMTYGKKITKYVNMIFTCKRPSNQVEPERV
ncbi:hypothetical protein FDP41_010320 [Naegleria fowleri]|uniref:Uncharacterized protein n=1 Tax=Naegleria fowleri TaxID=5763 RepID=A0A6A5CD27_NAEFO|nr:uncharacterized protein FDP41_010320 [Naegleria fowleri]KAF0983255.1 hypothetical protein FDP41_010320 [Naegleria fowleri]